MTASSRPGSATRRTWRRLGALITALGVTFSGLCVAAPAYAADTVAPVVSPPANPFVVATRFDSYSLSWWGNTGVIGTHLVNAQDDVDGELQPTCSTNGTDYSGSARLPVGDYTVTCRATDQAGNTGQASFAMRVIGFEEQWSGYDRLAVTDVGDPLTYTVTRSDGGSTAGLAVTMTVDDATFEGGGTSYTAVVGADGSARSPRIVPRSVEGIAFRITGKLRITGFAGVGAVNITNSWVVWIVAGPAVQIAVSGPTTMVAGQPATFSLTGTDAVGWQTTDFGTPSLAISPDGSCTGLTCTATTLGQHTITATSRSASASTTSTVAPGPAARLIVTPSSTSVAAGGAVSLTARAADTYGHDLGDVTSSTSFSIGPDGSCSSTACTATVAGAHTITGDYGGLTGTVALTVTPAAAAAITVTPAATTVVAGEAVTYKAMASDRYGNTLGDVTSSTTFDLGSAGACSGAVCTATLAGAQTVRAGFNGLTSTAGVTVRPAAAAQVSATDGNAQQAVAKVPFDKPLVATVTDLYGNRVPGATVTFAVTSGDARFGPSNQPASTATAVSDSSGVATAPALTAGATAGAVTVTASTGTATGTSFTLAVIKKTDARADIAVTVSAPASLARSSTGLVTFTVTNKGPQTAGSVQASLVTGVGLTIVDGGGGKVGPTKGVATFSVGSLAKGASNTYTVKVQVGAKPPRTVTALGAALSDLLDPTYANNVATTATRTT